MECGQGYSQNVKVSFIKCTTKILPNYHCVCLFIEIKCPKLKPPSYGKIYVSGSLPGSYAFYRCSYGYSVQGSRRRVCQQSGEWDGTDVVCKRSQIHYGGYKRYNGHNDDSDD